jgi:ABC-type transport system involved in multi-copper enzyme maturation permease subunit
MPAAKSPVVSNLNVMRVLFVKDWRLFRAPMVALIVVGAVCYLIALASIFYPQADHDTLDSLFTAALVSFELTGFLAAAFGGVAIAGERADRTADFLGLLPVRRMQIVLSKLTVSILMIGACAAFHLLILGLTLLAWSNYYPTNRGPHDVQWVTALPMWFGFTTSLFGIAWLLGTFLRSGPISACVSIATTIAWFAVVALRLDAGHYRDEVVPITLSSISLAVGLSTLVGGTIYYLRRIAP